MTSRWNTITDHLQSAIEAGTLQPGDRLPSEKELAEEWQVCRMTAHRAMDELHRLGLVHRKRRAGTVVAAPSVRRDKQPRPGKNVALCLFHANDYPQAHYLQGFRSALSDSHRLLLCDTKNSPEREAVVLEQARAEADAICIYPTCSPDTTAMLAEIQDSGIPIICLDRLPVGLNADAFFTDNYRSTYDSLQMLTARGHRRIAFVTTDRPRVSSVLDRREAFVDAITATGTANAEDLVVAIRPYAGYDFDRFTETIRERLTSLFDGPNAPTAVFCLEDYFMAATLEALEQMRLRVPHDVEVVSFSDIPSLLPRINRDVHRIIQRAYDIGQMAAERIERRLAGEVLPREVFRVPANFLPASSVPMGLPFSISARETSFAVGRV